MIVTEEEQSLAMEHGLQSALSYLEKEKLADINLNRISLLENQHMAGRKAEEAGRAKQILPANIVGRGLKIFCSHWSRVSYNCSATSLMP